MKKVLSALLSAVLLFWAVGLSSCGKKNADPVTVEMVVKDYGTVVIELYPDKAPKTVENFVSLVNDGFYDGLTFHRVAANLIVQGGDPTGTGYGDPSLKRIPGEFKSNGFKKNTLKHERGTISMARTNDPDSATSQFFICARAYPSWDGDYAAFGKVVKGIEIIDEMTGVPCDQYSRPLTPLVIETIRVVQTDTEQ